MRLEAVGPLLSICKVEDHSQTDLWRAFAFTGRTDGELSLVCSSDAVPSNVIDHDDGWRSLRVAGTMELSLAGVLSRISGVLADAGIPIFALSTFDTDYMLVKEGRLGDAVSALR